MNSSRQAESQRTDASRQLRRMERIYRFQAAGYDWTREKLLRGRRRLFETLPLPRGGVWVDVGAGTGLAAECWAARDHGGSKLIMLDIAPSMLKRAKRRTGAIAGGQVGLLQADAGVLPLAARSVDLITFSYSLSMIPYWARALSEAERALRPGGLIGVTDFHAGSGRIGGLERHSSVMQVFWKSLMPALGVVGLSDGPIEVLRGRFAAERIESRRTRFPLLGFPWWGQYLWIASKSNAAASV